MRRPVKNFDFLLLETWEYCIRYYWFIVLTSLICSIALSLSMDSLMATNQMWQDFKDYSLEHSGMGSAEIALILSFALEALILFLLYIWSDWRMARKHSSFMAVFHKCGKEIKQIDAGEITGSDAVLYEMLTYLAAYKASDLIYQNKMNTQKWINKKDRTL